MLQVLYTFIHICLEHGDRKPPNCVKNFNSISTSLSQSVLVDLPMYNTAPRYTNAAVSQLRWLTGTQPMQLYADQQILSIQHGELHSDSR